LAAGAGALASVGLAAGAGALASVGLAAGAGALASAGLVAAGAGALFCASFFSGFADEAPHSLVLLQVIFLKKEEEVVEEERERREGGMLVKGSERLIPKCDELFDPNEVTYEVLGWCLRWAGKRKMNSTRRENRSGEKKPRSLKSFAERCF